VRAALERARPWRRAPGAPEQQRCRVEPGQHPRATAGALHLGSRDGARETPGTAPRGDKPRLTGDGCGRRARMRGTDEGHGRPSAGLLPWGPLASHGQSAGTSASSAEEQVPCSRSASEALLLAQGSPGTWVSAWASWGPGHLHGVDGGPSYLPGGHRGPGSLQGAHLGVGHLHGAHGDPATCMGFTGDTATCMGRTWDPNLCTGFMGTRSSPRGSWGTQPSAGRSPATQVSAGGSLGTRPPARGSPGRRPSPRGSPGTRLPGSQPNSRDRRHRGGRQGAEPSPRPGAVPGQGHCATGAG